MLPFKISDADLLIVKKEKNSHKSELVRTRMQVLYFLSLGLKRKECGELANVCANSVTAYIRLYNQGGLDSIRRVGYKGRSSPLAQHKDAIIEELTALAPSAVNRISSFISQKYGIVKSNERVRCFLKQCGFRYRKVKHFPGKGKDIEKLIQRQAEFLADKLNPLITSAMAGESDLLFVDAAHFVQGKFDARLWSEKPMYAPSSHGRYRVNVLGALDVVNKKVFPYFNDTYVNAPVLVSFLEWLGENHFKDIGRKLNIVLDNARYQKCELVQEAAKGLNITLHYLPAYSPNLNLIERLWRLMKKEMGRVFVEDKKAFYKAIIDLVTKINSGHFQDRLNGICSTDFQVFEKSQILTW